MVVPPALHVTAASGLMLLVMAYYACCRSGWCLAPVNHTMELLEDEVQLFNTSQQLSHRSSWRVLGPRAVCS